MDISDETRKAVLHQIELKKALLRHAEKLRNEAARRLAEAEAEIAAISGNLVGEIGELVPDKSADEALASTFH